MVTSVVWMAVIGRLDPAILGYKFKVTLNIVLVVHADFVIHRRSIVQLHLNVFFCVLTALKVIEVFPVYLIFQQFEIRSWFPIYFCLLYTSPSPRD